MREKEGVIRIAIIWRGRKLIVEMNAGATLKDFGTELQKLTDVKAETLRLIVPEFASKSSKLLRPFSDEHSNFRLPENLATENKPIRMMGVPEAEVDEVLESAKTDLRIAGFDEEERRLRLRMLDRPRGPIKLPQGAYIFCDFRTLQLPGVELYPPASEALRRMHMLAADPGIVAIMNKHRWRVGVMSEMAPIGYVGISPKCILGLNKNHGEEISLRLRTDDLKGFRKFESIKKTLLHELAHMVYSEHDANFYALDKQLNQEAGSLDWTRSQSETLSGIKHSNNHHDYYEIDEVNNLPQKVGGNMSDQLASARASSVAAAFRRISTSATSTEVTQAVHDEPDPDDSDFSVLKHSSTLVSSEMKKIDSKNLNNQHLFNLDLVPGVSSVNKRNCEPNPDDSHGNDTLRIYTPTKAPRAVNDGDTVMTDVCCPLLIEPDPDDSDHFADSVITSSDPNDILKDKNLKEREKEPDPDDSEVISIETVDEQACREGSRSYAVPDFGKFQVNEVSYVEPDPDESIRDPLGAAVMQTDEPDPDDQELKRIQDPVSAVCNRMQKAIKMLQSQLNHMEASKVLETLVKIIRNVIEHPDEVKFRRLRKANPFIQRTIASSTAALEILSLIGFSEDVVFDNTGKAEAYLVLKRNDPGLLWLAKSSIETCIAC